MIQNDMSDDFIMSNLVFSNAIALNELVEVTRNPNRLNAGLLTSDHGDIPVSLAPNRNVIDVDDYDPYFVDAEDYGLQDDDGVASVNSIFSDDDDDESVNAGSVFNFDISDDYDDDSVEQEKSICSTDDEEDDEFIGFDLDEDEIFIKPGIFEAPKKDIKKPAKPDASVPVKPIDAVFDDVYIDGYAGEEASAVDLCIEAAIKHPSLAKTILLGLAVSIVLTATGTGALVLGFEIALTKSAAISAGCGALGGTASAMYYFFRAGVETPPSHHDGCDEDFPVYSSN